MCEAVQASKLLLDTSSQIANQIKLAENQFQTDMSEFVEKKLGRFLGPGIGIYAELLANLCEGTQSRKQLDDQVKKLYKHSSVCDAYESLLEAENDWDNFLKKVDKALLNNKSLKVLKQSDQVPDDITVVNARSGEACLLSSLCGEGKFVHFVLLRHFAWLPWRDHVASIEKELHSFTQAASKVIVISFGSQQGGRGWLEATGCNLELYLDQPRHFYQAVGLQRSVLKVWNMSVINYYASQKASGRQLPKSIEGVEDDPLQMGGDFTVKCSGKKIVLAHPSSNPTDRPAIEKIFSAMT